MRSGTCAAQQTLTPEAASVLKHSLSLAARRGHSHVTPLHVASTLLSSKSPSTTSLRRACLKSHPPHPLQSRALELCFNVALNRLPTSPPLLHSPSLSNALVAALKRAQAHQRRGSDQSHQQQQHPLLAVKVELQHLIISILDDPSVSRVMREAGFSSTAVKTNLEQYNNSNNNNNNNNSLFISPHFFSPQSTNNPFFFSSSSSSSLPHPNATNLVFEVFLGKKSTNNSRSTNVVVVGDSIGMIEGVVFEVMRKVKMGEVPDEMKGVKLVEFPFPSSSSSASNVCDEFKRKLRECGDGGVVVYVGDLKWIVEGNNNNNNNNNEVEKLVGEIERLLKGEINENNNNNKVKIWVMGMASYQIYMRCQMRQPALETQWALQAVPVPPPSSGLGLTLHASSVYDSRPSLFNQSMETKPTILIGKEEHHEKLSCCGECITSFENEVHHLKSFQSKQVPFWLQQSHPKDELMELRRKWNRFCSNLHREGSVQSFMVKNISNSSSSSSYPWWKKFHESSNSISFTDHNHQTQNPLISRFRKQQQQQQSCTTIEFDLGNSTTKQNQDKDEDEPSLNSLKHMVVNNKEVKITLALGNPLSFDSSAESTEIETERKIQREEISKVLEENVPWQSESIPGIAESVISIKKNEKSVEWILMEGNDSIGKRKMSIAIAESVFGSVEFLLNLNAKSEEIGISRSEMVEKALKSNRNLVILVEDLEMADSQFIKLLEKFLENGFENTNSGKTIFILTKDDSSTNKTKNRVPVIEMSLKFNARADLNTDQKRKSESEIENNRIKRTNNNNNNNRIDLNMKAVTIEEEEELPNEQRSPISSDLTRETTICDPIPKPGIGIVESISNRFILNQKQGQEMKIKEELIGKLKENCKKGVWKKDWEFRVWDWENSRFRVEEGVLEGFIEGFGTFSKRVFGNWVKEIFQTSLESGRYGGKGKWEGKGEGGIDIRLCLDHKHNLEEEIQVGYMGSCLPKKIKLSSMD